MGKLIKVLDLVDHKWKIFSEQIPDGDEDQADKPLAIITSVGDFGIGKSFLQNILLGAIKKGENFYEDETELFEVFPLETSIRTETKGIDMLNEYLELPHENKEMVLALWDTEGPSDPNQPQNHANIVFALSAYFSGVLIYNVKEKLSISDIDKLQVFLHSMRTQRGDKKVESLRFQNLIIVLRDADDEFGYCWAGGKAYMEHMKTEGNNVAFFGELEDTFKSVLLFMMPTPNQAVRAKGIRVTHMRDIDDILFWGSLRIFTEKLLREIVQPGIVGGEVLRVRDLKLQLAKFATRFKDGTEQTSDTLANALKEKYIEKEADVCFKQYQIQLLQNRGWFQAEATRTERHNELKRKTLENFTQAIERHYVEVDIVDKAVRNLNKLLDERFKAYNDKAHTAQTTMWMVGGVVIVAGAIALIVCFPAQAAFGVKILNSLYHLVVKAIPLVIQLLEKLNERTEGPVYINASVMAFLTVSNLRSSHVMRSIPVPWARNVY